LKIYIELPAQMFPRAESLRRSFKGTISPLQGSEERWYSGYNHNITSGLKPEREMIVEKIKITKF
jgi:hypothetical protein